MVTKIKDLPKQFLGIAVGAAIAGPTIGIIQSSPIPSPIRTGTSALIGVGLLKGTGRLLK